MDRRINEHRTNIFIHSLDNYESQCYDLKAFDREYWYVSALYTFSSLHLNEGNFIHDTCCRYIYDKYIKMKLKRFKDLVTNS